MQDVTLTPAMGAYLNMLNSYKPGVVNGVPQIANENYGRELMQLFTIGLYELNADGTPHSTAAATRSRPTPRRRSSVRPCLYRLDLRSRCRGDLEVPQPGELQRSDGRPSTARTT